MNDCAHTITETDKKLYIPFCLLCKKHERTFHTVWCWSCWSRMPMDKTTLGCIRCKTVAPAEMRFHKITKHWVLMNRHQESEQ